MGKKSKLFNVLNRSLAIGPKTTTNRKGQTVKSNNKILTGSWESSGWFLGSGGTDGKSTKVVQIENDFNALVKKFNEQVIPAVSDIPEILRGTLPKQLNVIRGAINNLSNTTVENNEDDRGKFIEKIKSLTQEADDLIVSATQTLELANKRGKQRIQWKLPSEIFPFTEVSLTYLNARAVPEVKDGGGELQLYASDNKPVEVWEVPAEGDFKLIIRVSETISHLEQEETINFKARKGSPKIEWEVPKEILFSTDLNIKLIKAKASAGDGKLEVTLPEKGQFGTVGDAQPFEVSLHPTDTHNACTRKGTINVIKAEQIIEWKPPDVPYEIGLGDDQRNAKIKKGINRKLKASDYQFPNSPKVGKAQLRLTVPSDDNWLQTQLDREIQILPPTPPRISGNRRNALRTAKVSFNMQGKITDGEPKPSDVNKVRGGHSGKKILSDTEKYDPQIEQRNDDGTASVKFKMKLENGTWSDVKTSTVAPENWDDNAILAATIQVGNEPPTYTRTRDGSTLHTAKVNGVQWDVIKDSRGNVRASYPTGGTMTSRRAFDR